MTLMIKIQINDKYEYMRTFVESIPEIFEHTGEILYDKRNRIKKIIAPDGTPINVKRYHVPSFINRLIYSYGLRKAKGLRAYTYPAILHSHGIETPDAIAYIEERNHGLLGYSYLVTTQCLYEHELYDLGRAAEGTYEEMTAALAQTTARMHESGIMHRDYSPGNVLWTKKADGYHFSLLDINRMYFGPVSMRQGCRNFARLWAPRKAFIIMAHEYARARGFDEAECERLVIKYRTAFWKRYSKRHPVNYPLEL